VSEIPKIARARLEQQSAGAGSHPDADQMTAFLERSLGAREREQVLEHLARCAGCREVVALALPPEEEAARAAQPAPEFQWFGWQTLRWAAVAATFVIAVSLIFQTYQKAPETSSRETAENPPVAAPAATEAAKPAEAAPADETQPRQEATAAKEKAPSAPSSSTVAVLRDQETEVARGPSKLDSVTHAKTGQKSGELAAGGVGGGISGGRMDDSKKLGSEGKVEAANGRLAAKAAVPAPAMAAESKRGPAAPASQQQQVAGLAQQAPPSPPAAREELQRQAAAEPAARAAADQAEAAKVTSQNEIVAVESVEKDADKHARNAAAPAGAFGESRKMSAAAATLRWVITAQGHVQRSMDNGSTWKSVRLDNHIRFRAVAAAGSEVWAGGEGGALYRSSDSGDHWTRVALPEGLASATIVRVEFADAEHGTLATSSGETWATSDSGATWQKQ
jgi:hypothetical protein